MSEDLSETEAKLRRLGERLQAGWAKRHPVTEQELEMARKIVREQVQEERKIRAANEKAKEEAIRNQAADAEKPAQSQQETEQEKLNRQNQSPRHGH